jgi:RNA polymerase sigma-70 factor, ECF subfamily
MSPTLLQLDLAVEDDILIMRQIAERDTAAYQVFYKKHSGLLYAAIIHLIGHHQTAKDILHEVILQLWNKASQYDESAGTPLSWLLGLAREKSLERIKQEEGLSHDRYPAHSTAHHLPRTAAAIVSPRSKPMQSSTERNSVVYRAINKLNHTRREAVLDQHFKGLAPAETAALMEEPIGIIQARIRRGTGAPMSLLKMPTGSVKPRTPQPIARGN